MAKIKPDSHEAIRTKVREWAGNDKKIKITEGDDAPSASTFVHKNGRRFEIIPMDGWAYVHSSNASTNVENVEDIPAAIDKLASMA